MRKRPIHRCLICAHKTFTTQHNLNYRVVAPATTTCMCDFVPCKLTIYYAGSTHANNVILPLPHTHCPGRDILCIPPRRYHGAHDSVVRMTMSWCARQCGAHRYPRSSRSTCSRCLPEKSTQIPAPVQSSHARRMLVMLTTARLSGTVELALPSKTSSP